MCRVKTSTLEASNTNIVGVIDICEREHKYGCEMKNIRGILKVIYVYIYGKNMDMCIKSDMCNTNISEVIDIILAEKEQI